MSPVNHRGLHQGYNPQNMLAIIISHIYVTSWAGIDAETLGLVDTLARYLCTVPLLSGFSSRASIAAGALNILCKILTTFTNWRKGCRSRRALDLNGYTGLLLTIRTAAAAESYFTSLLLSHSRDGRCRVIPALSLPARLPRSDILKTDFGRPFFLCFLISPSCYYFFYLSSSSSSSLYLFIYLFLNRFESCLLAFFF